MMASQEGHLEVVDKLLQHGATVDLQKNVRISSAVVYVITVSYRQDGRSSLILASDNGHVEVVDKLLQHGATADLQNNVMTTPFFYLLYLDNLNTPLLVVLLH